MVSFKTLPIRIKILLIPIVGTIGFSIYLITSLVAMSQIVNQLDDAYAVEYKYLKTSEFGLLYLDKIKETLSSAVTMGETELLDTSNNYAEEFRNKIKNSYSINQNNAAFLKQLLADFNDYYQQAHGLSQEMVDGTMDFSTLESRSASMVDKLNALQDKLSKFQNEKNQSFNHAFESVSSKVESTSTIGIIIGLVTIIILFTTSYPIANSINKSLQSIISSLKNIAQDNGDLTVRLTTSNKDEIGDLVFWFNSFIEKLQSVIKNVVDTAVPLAQTANNIQNLSNETISSFERQTESINASKHSVEEMSHSVQAITSNAADAVSSARNANDEASNGKDVVDKTVVEIRQLSEVIQESSEIINQLNDDTNKVNVVLEVIRGIAEQTNLLALNAAIEAARAGEQGRGFAVVADEVRNLASRTQESTQQINQMLDQLQSAASKAVHTMESSISGVENSVKSANQAGDSLLEITSAISTISTMNDEIAHSTQQQTEVSKLMVQHVDDIQQSAEDASNASSEIAQVSNELTDLASELEKIALQFKV
ncbi:methyl-accepting chemotaxis protein [Litorilituus lipolyticus]|uniref:Methyl-accepting chemotaxis protein n=1 Tax=Litorilituus lipolyticus TaxID=2491017 RepID=A0A502KWC4_9GAMM|nr:HAMP domain-containing methyl-accepting chemotaxis protein [Litorilituus lipolyticus]TPH12507.1 methyl-accepting chemotaxis protein [Litorilituus lipolyticus]